MREFCTDEFKLDCAKQIVIPAYDLTWLSLNTDQSVCLFNLAEEKTHFKTFNKRLVLLSLFLVFVCTGMIREKHNKLSYFHKLFRALITLKIKIVL